MAKALKIHTPVEPIQVSREQVAVISKELQGLQRQRAITIKSRNMQANRLQAIVAGTMGYSSTMPEKERTKKFVEASELIKQVMEGTAETPMKAVIQTTMIGIDAFNVMKEALEKEMVKQAKLLPVAQWVSQTPQRGFGNLFLAIIVGECGDLWGYENPAKVWRRMGCAPWEFEGKTLMGATWRGGKEGKLPASEWESYGYSPRRRSIAYLVGEGIVKQNGEGPYRKRYDATKLRIKELHPDYSDLRCHRHGMLLATKKLLLNLWWNWHGCPEGGWKA